MLKCLFGIELLTPTGIVDIGLIRDETNEAASLLGHNVDVHLLGENMADTVEQSEGADPATSEPTNTTPAESSPGTSMAASSSWYTLPSATLVPLARMQQLEAQIATFLWHIKPWMQKSIAEVEEKIEKKVAQQIEIKIRAVHQRLDAF